MESVGAKIITISLVVSEACLEVVLRDWIMHQHLELCTELLVLQNRLHPLSVDDLPLLSQERRYYIHVVSGQATDLAVNQLH